MTRTWVGGTSRCESAVRHTRIVSSLSDDLPVLIINGANFSDFDGFARECSRLLKNYTWRGNLDTFNDLLRGRIRDTGTRLGAEWLNSEPSRAALGYEATARRLESLLLTCHPSNRPSASLSAGAARTITHTPDLDGDGRRVCTTTV
jgi:hypothetical protein